PVEGVGARPRDDDVRVVRVAPVAVHGRRADGRGGQDLDAGGDVERVDLLHVGKRAVGVRILSLGDDEEPVRPRVDHRTSGDADLGHDVGRLDDGVGAAGDGIDPVGRVDEAVLPELNTGIGVEGIDAVVLGRLVDDIVDATIGQRDLVDVERLGI